MQELHYSNLDHRRLRLLCCCTLPFRSRRSMSLRRQEYLGRQNIHRNKHNIRRKHSFLVNMNSRLLIRSSIHRVLLELYNYCQEKQEDC